MRYINLRFTYLLTYLLTDAATAYSSSTEWLIVNSECNNAFLIFNYSEFQLSYIYDIDSGPHWGHNPYVNPVLTRLP